MSQAPSGTRPVMSSSISCLFSMPAKRSGRRRVCHGVRRSESVGELDLSLPRLESPSWDVLVTPVGSCQGATSTLAGPTEVISPLKPQCHPETAVSPRCLRDILMSPRYLDVSAMSQCLCDVSAISLPHSRYCRLGDTEQSLSCPAKAILEGSGDDALLGVTVDER